MTDEIMHVIAEQYVMACQDGCTPHDAANRIVVDLERRGYEIKPKTQGQVIFRCDGCGREEAGWFARFGDAIKPQHWFQRSDDDGTQLACSRPCIDRIAEASGKTRVVRPV